MPDLTDPHGYPYPLDSDPVSDGAYSTRQLAQAVNDKLGRLASGNATVSVVASSSATLDIPFPAGRFDDPPHVVCTARGDLYFARPGATTDDGFTVKVIRRDGSSDTVDVSVDWIAHAE